MFVRMFVTICAVSAAAACNREGSAAAAGRLRIAIEAAPTSLDPRYSADADSGRIGDLVHCSLVPTSVIA